ncbi:MAG: YkgJ family cysteine cluster protein [Flavobacteriales bacterium]|nr:YkgJ family cysteine cluster protein [Flavobacteriales bacterium]
MDRKQKNKWKKRLVKLAPRELDRQMHTAHEEVFERLDCLTCANCCKTTGPLFTDKDIERISKHLRIPALEFMTRYLREDEDGDMVLQEVPCHFLDENNYCRIYSVRPKACREYPHTDRVKQHQILDLTLKNVSVCPGVEEIVTSVIQGID